MAGSPYYAAGTRKNDKSSPLHSLAGNNNIYDADVQYTTIINNSCLQPTKLKKIAGSPYHMGHLNTLLWQAFGHDKMYRYVI